MKVWILVDDQNIVRCMASEECNLHQSKIDAGMTKHFVSDGGIVGDEYKDEKWTAHPENYPQPSESEIREQKISAEMQKMAEDSLIAKGEIEERG